MSLFTGTQKLFPVKTLNSNHNLSLEFGINCLVPSCAYIDTDNNRLINNSTLLIAPVFQISSEDIKTYIKLRIN